MALLGLGRGSGKSPSVAAGAFWALSAVSEPGDLSELTGGLLAASVFGRWRQTSQSERMRRERISF
jgi:hypothetical protein